MTQIKKPRQYRYKCRRCGDWFRRECFGYAGYSAWCDKCFCLLLKVTSHEEYLGLLKTI